MCHHIQSSALVFVEKNIHENAPTTIHELRQQLIDVPDNKVTKHLMRFGSSLRGTRAYWAKCHSELTDMITQLGSLALFFTFSVTDTKWHDLHTLMPRNSDVHALNTHRRMLSITPML